MQSTTLLWAFRADDVSPVKIRPVFSPLRGGCYFNGYSISVLILFLQQFGGLPSFPRAWCKKEIAAGSTRGQAAPTGRRKGYEAHMRACVSSRAGRGQGIPIESSSSWPEKGPDQMLGRCSLQHRLSKRVYVYATW